MDSEKLIRLVSTDKVTAGFPEHFYSLGAIAPQNSQFLFLSGQISLDPVTNQVVGETAKEQAIQVLKNISAVLMKAGSSFQNTVKCTLYLADFKYYEEVNQTFGSFCPVGHLPARSTVAVNGLPKNVMVEIDTVAMVP